MLVLTPRLYRGSGDYPKVPFYMSNNALQAVIYAITKPEPQIFTTEPCHLVDWSLLRPTLNMTESLWYLDHAYGTDSKEWLSLIKVKPGIYDAEVGEALITTPIDLIHISGKELFEHILNTHRLSGGDTDISDDTLYAIHKNHLHNVHKLFGRAAQLFIDTFLTEDGYNL
jgi:hypothetical protein